MLLQVPHSGEERPKFSCKRIRGWVLGLHHMTLWSLLRREERSFPWGYEEAIWVRWFSSPSVCSCDAMTRYWKQPPERHHNPVDAIAFSPNGEVLQKIVLYGARMPWPGIGSIHWEPSRCEKYNLLVRLSQYCLSTDRYSINPDTTWAAGIFQNMRIIRTSLVEFVRCRNSN